MIDIHKINDTIRSIGRSMDDITFTEHISMCHGGLSGISESYFLINSYSDTDAIINYNDCADIKHGIAYSLILLLDILNYYNISLKRLESKYNKSGDALVIRKFDNIIDYIASCHYLVAQSYQYYSFEIGPKHNNWSMGIYQTIVSLCHVLDQFNIDIQDNFDNIIEDANLYKIIGWYKE